MNGTTLFVLFKIFEFDAIAQVSWLWVLLFVLMDTLEFSWTKKK